MELETLSRRCFLTQVAGGVVAASFFPGTVLGKVVQNSQSLSDRFSFVDHSGLGKSLGRDIFNGQYIPLHKETALPLFMLDKNDYRNTVSLLKKIIIEGGGRWNESNQIVWTYQHFGVPDQSNDSNKLLQYCMSVEDYLNRMFPSIFNKPISWYFLTKHNLESRNNANKFRGFVGKNTYLVYRVNVKNEARLILDPGLVNVQPVDRAINFIRSNSKNVPTSGTIYIIHGPTSLVAPFSELIHLITNEPSLRYTNYLLASGDEEHAYQLGRVFGETITEATGVILASRYMHEYGNDERMYTIRHNSRSLSQQFPLMRNVFNYIQQYGVQRILNQYIENPNRLIKKIKATA
jgi:hypothetical protein